LRARFESLLRWKRRVVEELESRLDPRVVEAARRDHHARRRPRHCGMTIHTGVGCSYGCVYCYIWDMGFPGRPEPYPLPPEGMALALARNPYVLPGHTMAAYGSVTEPFLPETRSLAVAYIREVYRWLRLPSQVSTKSVVDEELARQLLDAEPRLSLLLTVVALGEWARRLEPGAPSPEERIAAAGRAARMGLRVALFLRPIIPGVTDVQAGEILDLARSHGIRDVVPGTLRVTEGIVKRLAAAGVDEGLLLSLLPRRPRSLREQVPIRGGEYKRRVIEEARARGFRVHPSACSHNMHAHETPCYACSLGPCAGVPEPPGEDEVRDAVEALGGRVRGVEVAGGLVVLYGLEGARRDVVEELLGAWLKLRVVVREGGSGVPGRRGRRLRRPRR